MLIVPDVDALAVEVKISPRDIEQVYVGQTATMKFAAFNQKTTPEIDGEISVVSADITQDQRTGMSYYIARAVLKPEEFSKLGSAKLVPGMPVDVFVKTQGRTALSYLVKPLWDQAERAFKER
jgi:HlyD family secretion protein